MLRIGQVEATATQDGKYTDGSVAGGIAATRLRAAAFNAMQEELAHIVESAGLALDINDMTQVLKAIQKLTLSRANPFADIKSDGAAAISTALTNLGLGNLPTFGTAASKDVGTGAGQIPDMSAWTGSYGATEAAGTWYQMPNGIIVQEGIVTTNGNATITLPIPFPNRILGMQATKLQGYFTPVIAPNGSSLSTFLLGSTNGSNWSTGDPIHWRLEGI